MHSKSFVFLFDSYRGKENGRLMLYISAASRKRNLVFSTICSKMLLYSFLNGQNQRSNSIPKDKLHIFSTLIGKQRSKQTKQKLKD